PDIHPLSLHDALPISASTAPATPSATPASPSPAASPTASIATVPGGVSDSISGMSYPLLASPWANGCPASLSNQQTATWTAGERSEEHTSELQSPDHL